MTFRVLAGIERLAPPEVIILWLGFLIAAITWTMPFWYFDGASIWVPQGGCVLDRYVWPVNLCIATGPH